MILSPVIAHRGVRSLCPENTYAAFAKAAELGVACIETDVSLLDDGTPAIIHDYTLERTSDHSGTLAEITRADVPTIDVGSWFSEQYRGQRIPLLETLLPDLVQWNLGLNLEIKIHPELVHQTEYFIDTVLAVLDACPVVPLLLSSFSMLALTQVRKKNLSIALGCLFDILPPNYLRIAKDINAASIHMNYRNLTQTQAAHIRENGFELYVFTANDSRDAARLYSWGVNGIITDYPQDFLSHVPCTHDCIGTTFPIEYDT